MPSSPRVFDSWAIVALLQDERAADAVQALMVEAQQTARPMLITAVNLGEVWYQMARRRSAEAADRTVDEILRLGLAVADADWELTRLAADLKARYRLSSADCFAAALAKQHGVAVITGDPEFRQLEREVKVRWL